MEEVHRAKERCQPVKEMRETQRHPGEQSVTRSGAVQEKATGMVSLD